MSIGGESHNYYFGRANADITAWVVYFCEGMADSFANMLGLHPRTALNLCKKWCNGGFIIQHGNAPKSRKYELADEWIMLVKA